MRMNTVLLLESKYILSRNSWPFQKSFNIHHIHFDQLNQYIHVVQDLAEIIWSYKLEIWLFTLDLKKKKYPIL